MDNLWYVMIILKQQGSKAANTPPHISALICKFNNDVGFNLSVRLFQPSILCHKTKACSRSGLNRHFSGKNTQCCGCKRARFVIRTDVIKYFVLSGGADDNVFNNYRTLHRRIVEILGVTSATSRVRVIAQQRSRRRTVVLCEKQRLQQGMLIG